MINVIGGLVASLLAWVFFRNTDDKDKSAWDGAALAITKDLIDAHGVEVAQGIADLWQLDAERAQAMRDE